MWSNEQGNEKSNKKCTNYESVMKNAAISICVW